MAEKACQRSPHKTDRNYLRQKIEQDPSSPKYILTERGVGYRFVDYTRDR